MIKPISHKVLVIAEAGVNHDGDLKKAMQLIDAAADSGADVVKFQTFKAQHLVTTDAELAQYQRRVSARHICEPDGNSQLRLLEKLQLTREDHTKLKEHCGRRGVEFFSTAFDLGSLDLLMEMGARRVKIPSGEITNLPYLRKVATFNCDVIMSTGMADLSEVADAINCLEAAGLPKNKITLLHCTTEYPAPIEDVNLRAMVTMRDTFGLRVGYSDHTEGIDVPIAASALGAAVIEKHFTLDQKASGPDHAASIEPPELTRMVDGIRRIELALGSEQKKCTSSERRNLPLVRKSIVAAKAIRKGELFSEENLTVKRPASGISPMLWDAVIGKQASRSFAPDEQIQI